MKAYGERVREWAARQHADVRGAGAAEPFPSPERADYEELYRKAWTYLHTPMPRPLPKRLRKYWRRQLWTARACLEREGGATPP